MHLIGYAIHVYGRVGEYDMSAVYDEGYLDRNRATVLAEQLTHAAQATPLGQWQQIAYRVVPYTIPTLTADQAPHLSSLWQFQNYAAWRIPRSYAGSLLRFLAQLDCQILGTLEGAVLLGWQTDAGREIWLLRDDSGTLHLELMNYPDLQSHIPLFANCLLLDPLTIAARIVCVLRRQPINWTWAAEATQQWLLDLWAIDEALAAEPVAVEPVAVLPIYS